MATCDVAQLLADAKCFLCLHGKQYDIALAQMLCNLVEAAALPASCENLFQDGFDGPDGQILDASKWQEGSDVWLYNFGTAVEDPGGAGSTAWVSNSSMTDGYVQAKCLGDGYHQLMLRANPNSALSFYAATLDPVNEAIFIVRGVTDLALVNLVPGYTPGDILRLEVRGTRLTLKYNGTTMAVVSDTTGSAIAGPGLAGIKGGVVPGAIFDDFECCSWD